MENFSSADISTAIDNAEKEFSEMLKAHQVIEQEKLSLQRQILELQLKKKDIEMAESKSDHNLKQANIELKLLRSRFWSAKAGNV